MKAQYRIRYNRKKKLNKNGDALVQIEVYLNGIRKYISTGVYVKPNEWNVKKNEVVNCHNATQLNFAIRKTLLMLEENESALLYERKQYTIDDIVIEKRNKELNFVDFMRLEIEKRKHLRWAHKLYNVVINYLIEFKNDKILFSHIDFSFISDFDNFLRKKGLNENTIHKRHSVLKTFILLGIKKDIIDANNNPYRKFKAKRVPTTRVALEPDELLRIENLLFNENTKVFEEVRDLFLFSCYTGLRYEETQMLTMENVKNIESGFYVCLVQSKTQKSIELPLHILFGGKALPIIKKYIALNNDFIFPQFTNQYANRVLKMISVLANTDKPLSFHISRHTFGTMLAEKTQDPYLIKELMNHSQIHTSMIYIHASKKRMENKLKDVKW